MDFRTLTQKLAAFESNGFPFVTIYLNAEAGERGRDEYGIWLKKELSERAKDYEEDSAEAESFNRDVERIQNFIDTQVEPSANGIAVFACFGANEFFETAQIEAAFPNNRLFAFDRPHIFPLVRAIEQNPRYAVLWADTNKADIYLFGGEHSIDAETEAKVEEIQNPVTNRTQVGGWSQARYQRHVENFHLQHAKETVDELEKLMRDTKIEHLILCGDETVIMPILRPQLSKALEEKVIAALNLSQYASEEEIREATRGEMLKHNATSDMERARRVFDAANAAAGMGVLGVEATLAALSNGQVQELAISASFDAIDYDAERVEKVLEDYAPGDGKSENDELPEAAEPRQIADELIIRALNSAAEIHFIEDASLLQEIGGVGAVLRYNMNSTANG